MRRLIVGDLHGNLKGLLDALQKANFHPDKDMLYAVGDYVDGHPDTYELIEYLNALPNFKGVIGNHDKWFLDFAWTLNNCGQALAENIWYKQGGRNTIASYPGLKIQRQTMSGSFYEGKIPDHHLKFMQDLELYIELDDRRILIVHAGYERTPLGYGTKRKGWGKIGDKEIDPEHLMWTRSFWEFAENHKNPDYDKVFIGHTQDNSYPKCKKGIIWNIDSGAGYDGYVTVMDIDTLQYWKSEAALEYYPDFLKTRG